MMETVPHIIIVTYNDIWMVKWSKAHQFECLVIVVVPGSSPEFTILLFSWRQLNTGRFKLIVVQDDFL